MQKNFSTSTSLSDCALHEQVVTASKNEKQTTFVLLEYLALVDSRRLYAIMGYSSLWEYVHKALQYSEAQTSERVNAARLMKKAPEVKEELKNGALSLTSVSKLAAHVRREKCDQNETLELLKAVANKPTREVEKILAQESTEGARPDQMKVVTRTTTRITIEVENEFLELMNKVKELGGYDGMQAQEIFKTSMRDFIKRREVKNPPKTDSTRAPEVKVAPMMLHAEESIDSTAAELKKDLRTESIEDYVGKMIERLKNDAVKFAHPPSCHLSQSIKTKIRIRSKDQCEYVDFTKNRCCESKSKLQFDHIKPHAAHGPNTEENIRHYCATHSRLAAIQFFGEEKMREFLKT